MFRELKKLERDMRIMNNRAKYLVEDLKKVSEEIQYLIDDAKTKALEYTVVDAMKIMAVGEWPYDDDEEINIKLKKGSVEYVRVYPDEIYIGEESVIVKYITVSKRYFEDAIRLLCALAHSRYTRKSFASWEFLYYIPKKVKEAPIFIVCGMWFVAIAPIVEEVEDDP